MERPTLTAAEIDANFETISRAIGTAAKEHGFMTFEDGNSPSPDTRESLMRERAAIREVLAAWWRRWEALYKPEDRGLAPVGLKSIDDWAREQAPLPFNADEWEPATLQAAGVEQMTVRPTEAPVWIDLPRRSEIRETMILVGPRGECSSLMRKLPTA